MDRAGGIDLGFKILSPAYPCGPAGLKHSKLDKFTFNLLKPGRERESNKNLFNNRTLCRLFSQGPGLYVRLEQGKPGRERESKRR